MAEKVAVVRHGDYDTETGQLTQNAIRQAQKLARKIGSFFGREHVAPGRSLVLTSEVSRAYETGSIIAEALNLSTAIAYACLGTTTGEDEVQEYMSSYVIREISHLLDSYPCLVLVTHSRTSSSLPGELTRNRGTGSDLPRGHAWGVDIEASKDQHFWRKNVVTPIKP